MFVITLSPAVTNAVTLNSAYLYGLRAKVMR